MHMRLYRGHSVYLLFLIVIITTGCIQPGPGPEKPVSPIPGTGSSFADSPPQTTLRQVTWTTSPVITGTSVTVPEIQDRGTPDPAFIVNISAAGKISPGTTILPDNHDASRPRIIEVNQLGEILWQYPLPDDLKSYTNPGWDVEVLENGNILTVLPRKGVYEISRDKQVVWKYLDPKVSHDADRLKNGNTLVAFGAGDAAGDAQVKEIDPSGNRVWSWYAKDVFSGAEYAGISDEGWSHTNAVARLENGNTLVSLRNFNVIAEVDPKGKLVRTIGGGLLEAQHDPLLLPDGNILLANHGDPQAVMEIDPSGNIVWQFTIEKRKSWPVRDANLLPNGNILVTESDRIIEVTTDGEVVWQFRLATITFADKTDPANSAAARGFYKAERIPP